MSARTKVGRKAAAPKGGAATSGAAKLLPSSNGSGSSKPIELVKSAGKAGSSKRPDKTVSDKGPKKVTGSGSKTPTSKSSGKEAKAVKPVSVIPASEDDVDVDDDVALAKEIALADAAPATGRRRASGAEFEARFSSALGGSRHAELTRRLGEGVALEITKWESSRASHTPSGGEKVAALGALSRKMEQLPLLSTASQNHLARVYQASLLAADEVKALRIKGERSTSMATKKLIRRRIMTLSEEVADGELALEYLLGSTFRLIRIISNELTKRRYGNEGAAKIMGDVIAEGIAGFLQAAQEFDEARCDGFHTYAARLIRERVRMAIVKESIIRPVPSWGRVKRIAVRAKDDLTASLGRAPTTPELQKELLRICLIWADEKLTPAERALSKEGQQAARIARLRKQGMMGAIESIEDVLITSGPVASLDAPVSSDGDGTLGSMLAGPADTTAIDNVEREQLSAALRDGLALLTEREREIIMTRYGLIGDGEINFRELGERFGVSAERIRQIEKSALEKMAPPGSPIYQRLASFIPSNVDDGYDG